MTNFEIISSLLFFIFLTIFISTKKKNLETKQILPNLYFSMYKTKWGLKLMDSIGKKYSKFIIYSISILSLVGILFILIQTVNFLDITKKILIFIGLVIIVFLVFVPNEHKMPVTGFLGMIVIVYFLISGLYSIFTKPESAPPLGLVLPIPVKVPGIFGIPFSYWIISIFIIALIHEFSHGLIARKYNINVKSSGFAFVGANLTIISFIIIVLSILNKLRISKYNLSEFITFNFMDFSSPDVWIFIGIAILIISLVKSLWIPIIPAAFVEPDEKELKKRPQSEQLNVFVAGPLANIALGTSLIVISFLTLVPLSNSISEPNGVAIVNYVKDNKTFPAELSGIKLGETIKEIDGMQTPYRENLSTILKSKKPGDKVTIKTDNSTYELALARNPENSSQAFLGASLAQSTKIKDAIKIRYTKVLPFLFWFFGLIEMLIVLNFGIGLFNLLALGPLDGGRMLQLVLHKKFGIDKGNNIFQKTSLFFLFILFIYLFVIFKNIVTFFV